MEEVGLPLPPHGTGIDSEAAVFDSEEIFIKRYLRRIVERFPRLKVVLEHITTQQAVEFIEGAGPKLAATSPRTPRWNSTPKSSSRPARSTSWKPLPSFRGPDFYGLSPNRDKVTLRKESSPVPAEIGQDGGGLGAISRGYNGCVEMRKFVLILWQPSCAAAGDYGLEPVRPDQVQSGGEVVRRGSWSQCGKVVVV